MGQFLKKLRNDKHISQEKLALKFENDGFEVSINAISSWEKGKTIPDIDKLNFLASFYDVTVDDILDGEMYVKTDFDSIYLIHKTKPSAYEDLLKRPSPEDSTVNEYFHTITEEGEIIRKRFKKYVMELIDDTISRNDKEELIFFLKNCYVLNDDQNITSYFSALRRLKNQKISQEEKWWEAQKYIHPTDSLILSYPNLSDEGFLSPTVQRRMNYSEPWEKDYLLAMIQIQDPICDDPSRATSKYIERYEKEHGKQFDKEKITKDTIRFLIENGAMINRNFLSYQEGKVYRTRLIDTLEKAHNTLVKPIAVCVDEDESTKFFYVENNKRNRFFTRYDFHLVRPLRKLGYSYDEMFRMVDSNDKIPDEVYLRAAKLKGIDTDRDIRYIKADLNFDNEIFSLENYWPKYRKEEYDDNLLRRDELGMFEKELSEGVLTNTKIVFHWVGGNDCFEKYSYVIKQKADMNYQTFKNGRQPKRTKELLESLDSLTIEQIRNKFFQLGGQEND